MSVPLGRPHLCAGHSASPRSGSASGNWRPALASDSGRGISGSEGGVALLLLLSREGVPLTVTVPSNKAVR